MNKRFIRMTALLLTAVLLLGGCGNSPVDTMPDTTELSVSEKLELPKEVRLSGHRLLDICPTEGGYLLLSVDIWGWHLTTLDENLTVGETVDLSKEDPSPYRILEAGGHRWTLENDGDMESANYGCGVYCDGEFMMQTSRDPALMQLAWADDTLYTVHFHQLWRGKAEVEMPDQPGTTFWVRCVLRINDQSYAMVSAWTEDQGTGERTSVGRWLCPIDGTTTQLSLPESEFPILVNHACWNDAGTWVISDSKLYQTDGTNVTELCDLAAWGIDIYAFSSILPLEDGTFLVMDQNRLVHVDPSENKGGKLTIGLYLPAYDCSQAIGAFNLAETGWQVTTRTFEDLESMNLAMLNGDLDLICTSDTDALNNYAVKGLLAPIDETTTARVLPNLVPLCTVDGACVYLPRKVELVCCSIPASYVSAGDVADLERLISRIEDNCPETFESYDKSMVLQNILNQCGSGWIDWQTRSAHFDSDSFRSTLEFCNRFEDDEYTASINNGANYNAGKEWFQIYEQLYLGNYHYKVHDDPLKKTQARTLFPFPVGGYTGFGLNGLGFYAIVNGSNAAGGQAFLDFLFADDQWFDEPQTPSEIMDSEFPVNLTQLDKLLALQVSQTPSDETEQDARELREGLLNADHLMDPILGEPEQIILEEAEACFNGDITVEECARRIQNRIEIYLSERG